MDQIDARHVIQVTRELCEKDFAFFCAYFFHVRKRTKFIFNIHHKIVAGDMAAVQAGEIQNLIENIPPRYSKTEMCVVLFVAWCYAKNPLCEFIHLSYSDQLVMDNSDAIKSVIKSKEYQQLWPHVQITAHRDSKKAWSTVQGGTFYATASGGAVTGFGAGRMDEYNPETGEFKFSGCILIDDPLKPDDARHEPIREGVNRRWDETIKSRRNSPRTPTVVIMQRIHQKDFTNMLLGDTELTWFHRKLEALIDEGLDTERALWPAKHSVEALKAMRDKKNDRGQSNPIAGETFAGQYQQDPKPAGGGMVREEWWRYYANYQEVKNRCTFFFITADTAYTSNDANDPSALQLWGAEGKARLYLLDRIRGFWEFPELLQKTAEFWESHPYAKRLFIENKASGPSLAQSIKKARTTAIKDAGATVVLWKPKSFGYPEDKVGRVKLASNQIHAGVVWLPAPQVAPWIEQFVDEHSAFTENDTHAHDEDVDCETMAVSVWTKLGGGKRG